MTGKLRVSPEKLISKSSEFSQSDAAVQSLTRQMMDIVDQLKPYYSGDAATVFYNRMNGLQDDMEKLHKMIRKHTEDLTEMGREYQRSERENAQRASTLNVNEIV